MPSLSYQDVPHRDLVQIAQISVYGGNMTAFVSWANGRIYIEECFSSGQRYWCSEQDDSVRSTLERRGIIDNTYIKNAVIVDGQTGPRVAPEEFILQNWSTYVEKREALSFDIQLEIRDPLPVEAQSSLEYIAAVSLLDLFGY